MKDERKTKKQLINELAEMRRRIAELEASETGRKRAEEALRESEEKYRTLAENSPTGIFVSDAKRFIYVNQRLCEITGFSRDELLSMPDPVGSLFTPEEQKRVLAYALSRLSGRPTLTDYKARGIRKDGEEVLLKLTVSSIILSGRRVLQGAIEDITERVRAEEMRDRFFKLSLDMLCIASVDGYFKRLNPAFEETLGYTVEELMSSPLVDFIHPDDVAPTLTEVEKQMAGEPTVGFENRYRCKDGSYKWLSWKAIAYAKEGLLYAVARDITERKRAEEQLKAALAEKEVLLREVHHRVKNNLQVIISIIGMQVRTITDPQALQMLKDLQERARAMALVHEKLYQSQNLARIDFGAYLQELTASLLHSFEAGRTIALRLDAANIFISVDKAIPCGLMVTELMTNVLKYAFPEDRDRDRDREIRVAFELREGEYVLIVGDNGVGLPPELDWRTTKSLGLRLVNLWATHQLEGSLEVDSRDGTTFTIRFPKRK